jgi:chaperonin GroES
LWHRPLADVPLAGRQCHVIARLRFLKQFAGDCHPPKTVAGSTQRKQNKDMAKDNVNVRPLGDRVLVQPIEETEVKKGGIIIPDTAKEKPQEGKVVALGTGKTDDNGKKVEFTVKKGDKVLISKYGGTEIKIDNESYLIMREDDILGIIG